MGKGKKKTITSIFSFFHYISTSSKKKLFNLSHIEVVVYKSFRFGPVQNFFAWWKVKYVVVVIILFMILIMLELSVIQINILFP